MQRAVPPPRSCGACQLLAVSSLRAVVAAGTRILPPGGTVATLSSSATVQALLIEEAGPRGITVVHSRMSMRRRTRWGSCAEEWKAQLAGSCVRSNLWESV